MATVDIASSPDPYEDPPTFFQRHAELVSAGVVFALTVLLAVLSFPPFKSPEFAYAMLVPGVFWAYLRPRWRTFAWTLLGAQALAWTILLGWLRHVTWPGLLLLGPFIGVWVGCWYLAAWWVMPRIVGRPTMVRLAGVLGLAGAWVLLEWSRTWVLGGFPWLPLAASQWERSSILQIAAFTGAYGTSFVLVMMNLGFAAYAHRLFREGASGFNKRSQEFFLALFLLLVCVCVQFTESFNRRGYAGPLGRVALVQPHIPQDLKWDGARAPGILEVLEQLTMEAASGRPDLILWPEAVTPLAVRGDAAVKGWLESLVKRAGVPVLLGSVAVEDAGTPRERWYNGAFLATPESGVAERYYAKRQLVPFGEFVPFRQVLGWLEKVVPVGGDFSAGDSSAPLLVPLRGQFQVAGPLICYEDVYPQLARLSVLGGAGFLTVLTNNGWFGEGGAAYQHAAHAVLRAVETRRPVLRVGNGGWSGWIDEFGVVRATVTDRPEGSIYFRGVRTIDVSRDVRWADRNSFYVEHGDWFVLGSALMAMAALGLLRTGGVRTPPGDGEPGRMVE